MPMPAFSNQSTETPISSLDWSNRTDEDEPVCEAHLMVGAHLAWVGSSFASCDRRHDCLLKAHFCLVLPCLLLKVRLDDDEMAVSDNNQDVEAVP